VGEDRRAPEGGVKVTYDPEVDVLRVVLSDASIEESDEATPGLIMDYDGDGSIVALEMLDASAQIGNYHSNPR
jgi:uncharacterized protein YuzE